MNAWLITWEWDGEHANVDDPLIAIFSSRLSENRIAEFIEGYFLIKSASAGEMVYYANRTKEIPYKTEKHVSINGIPHGDRITCGDNPYIFARKVLQLKVENDVAKNLEIITWREPPTFGWKDKYEHQGEKKSLERKAA